MEISSVTHQFLSDTLNQSDNEQSAEYNLLKERKAYRIQWKSLQLINKYKLKYNNSFFKYTATRD